MTWNEFRHVLLPVLGWTRDHGDHQEWYDRLTRALELPGCHDEFHYSFAWSEAWDKHQDHLKEQDLDAVIARFALLGGRIFPQE